MIIAVLFLLFTSNESFANITETELIALNSNELIYKSRDIKNTPWPQVTIYTLIEGTTPREAASIFSDYEGQRIFVPDMLGAKIVKTISPTDIHVRFIMDNPWPIGNEEYTTGNILSKIGNSYRVSWYLVQSDSLKDTRGKVDFITHKKGTLFKYQSFVHPKSGLAFLATGFLKSKITNSISAIVNYLGALKKKDPDKLLMYTKKMDTLLRNTDSD